MNTLTALDTMRFFKQNDVEVLTVLKAMGIKHAELLALGLASLEDVRRFLLWACGDESRAEELWDELQRIRAVRPKEAPRNALGWKAPNVDSKSPPWLPGPDLWQLSLPRSASLVGRARRSGVRNQNPRGTCVAFATCKAVEILRDDGVSLSPQFLYYFMKQPERDEDTHDDGSYAMISLDVVQDVGVCREALHPYDTTDYAAEGEAVCGPRPSGAAIRDAEQRAEGVHLLVQRSDTNFVLGDLAPKGLLDWLLDLGGAAPTPDARRQLTLLQFARAALSGALGPSPRPVVGCFTWFHSSSMAAADDGEMSLPFAGEQADGGHAVTVVGYADDADYPGGGYLVIQNSWGSGWPRASADGPGLFRMPYAYAAAYMREAGVPMLPGDERSLRIEVRPRRGARAAQSLAAASAPSVVAPRFCTGCGAALSPGGRFCTQCGTGVRSNPTAPPIAAPVTATSSPPRSRADDLLAAHQARMESTLGAHQARLAAMQARLGGTATAADGPSGASGRCIYCGSSGYGSCSSSPVGRHKHDADGSHCAWCGSSGYGSCSSAPHGKHEHGSGRGCRFCGSGGYGSCSSSPSQRHEH